MPNRRLGLLDSGQRAMIYFAPHPPARQKQLNDCISDAFYRELFMSPCLSGWDDGEAKHAYMKLCHQVLSRSQLNDVAKLREAGIVVNNLVVLPNLSNISLANNGAHVSLGSRKLTAAMREGHSGFGPVEEKLVGDLTIKIVEHFLPLFVGAYSAAPYRLDFADFHPEKVLGFLPHELDYTRLRMIWRRWRKKADLKIFGYAMTPCGPSWIDRILSALFRLKGDWVADFRLLDYLVAVMSTESSPQRSMAVWAPASGSSAIWLTEHHLPGRKDGSFSASIRLRVLPHRVHDAHGARFFVEGILRRADFSLAVWVVEIRQRNWGLQHAPLGVGV
jgi:hypothetical protein